MLSKPLSLNKGNKPSRLSVNLLLLFIIGFLPLISSPITVIFSSYHCSLGLDVSYLDSTSASNFALSEGVKVSNIESIVSIPSFVTKPLLSLSIRSKK